MRNLGKLKPRWSSSGVRYAGRASSQSPEKSGDLRYVTTRRAENKFHSKKGYRMRGRVIVLIFLLCLSMGVSSYLALGQGVIKKVFASRPFNPSEFTSYKVDATVFQPPGWQVYDEGESDQSSRAYTIGAPGLVTSLALGWMQKSGNHLVFFTGAINGSADAWTHIQLKDSEGIPDKVGPEEVDGVGVRIKGKIKRIDFTLAVCGLSWTQAFGKITINGLEGDLSILKVGNAPAGPSLDFDSCVPGPQAATGIAKAREVIPELIQFTGALLDAFSTARVALGPEEEYEALFMLPSSIKREELLAKVLGKKPLNVSIQLGFRSSAALAAGALSGGYITIDSVELVGFAGVEPVVHLEVWYYFHQEGFLTRRLAEVQEYNIKKAQYGLEDYPSIPITCPIPYPGLPTIQQRGKLYVISGDRLWRLDYLQLDDGQRTPVQGDTCSFGPIVMDRSHKLVFGFERAVADLIVAGFRTDPPSSSLQQGQEFKVFMEVINIGEISALEADRRSPISGETKVRVTAIGTGATGEATITGGLCGYPGKDCSLQPGETRTIQVAGPPEGWIAPRDAQNLVLQATIDPDDVIDEGISGEQNNTASLVVYLAAPTLPDPAFKNPRDPKGEVGFEQLGDTVLRLWADVTNLSPVPASNVEVVFSIDEPLPVGAMTIGKTTIPYLPGNSVRRAWVEWNVCKVPAGPHRVGVGIDPDNKIQELNERNNNTGLTVTIPASANKAKLTTDKFTYQSGEVVTIRFFNGCSQTISLHDSAPWVIKDSQGRVIFAPTALQVITEVRPGETKTWTWNQKDNNGRQVPVGTYTVELKTMDAGTYTASFEIKALVQAKLDVKAVAEISWPIPTRIEISVLVLVNGIPMSTPASQLFPINGLVSLTALQQEVNVPPFGTFYFKQWECESPARGREVFRTPTIMFTLGEDTVCTVVYEKE